MSSSFVLVKQNVGYACDSNDNSHRAIMSLQFKDYRNHAQCEVLSAYNDNVIICDYITSWTELI